VITASARCQRLTGRGRSAGRVRARRTAGWCANGGRYGGL